MDDEKYERYEQRRKEKARTIARKAERHFKYQRPQLFLHHEPWCYCPVCEYEKQYVAEHIYKRVWYKRRFGYYEKPSVLRRKQEKMSWLRNGYKSLRLEIGLMEQFLRTGPNAAGK